MLKEFFSKFSKSKKAEEPKPTPAPVKKDAPTIASKPETKEQKKTNNSAGVPWSAEEIALFEKGLSNVEISKKTGRSLDAVKRKRYRLNYKKK